MPATETDRFVQLWTATARIMAGHPGFRRTRLHLPLHDDTQPWFVNVAEWDSEQALQAASTSAEFQASTAWLRTDPSLHVTAHPAVYEIAVELPENPR